MQGGGPSSNTSFQPPRRTNGNPDDDGLFAYMASLGSPPMQQPFQPFQANFPQGMEFNPFAQHSFSPFQAFQQQNSFQQQTFQQNNPFQASQSPSPRPTPSPTSRPTPSPSSRPTPSPEDDVIPLDDDVVPETQPKQNAGRKKRSHKKKAPEAPREKKQVQPWTEEEEVALARAWLDCSENPIIANDQDLTTFWRETRKKFYELMNANEPYRQPDSISGKWTDINKKCKIFSSIYNRMVSGWQSGQNNEDVQSQALIEYGVGRPAFNYIAVWNVLKNAPKWLSQVDLKNKIKGRSKKSRTESTKEMDGESSDARAFDLNEQVEFVHVEPRRPPSRDFTKAQRASSSSSRSTATTVSNINKLQEEMHEKLDTLVSLRREQTGLVKRRIMHQDLHELRQPLPDDEPARTIAIKLREDIAKSYMSGE
ncbi:hypothetical protein SSX86_031766 [Deinandra increscens subsp. villosa]|uniref:No apical meristem-associated C-terminal domain-containing protein n=1 Tax=Deinandra increscens subsp. villosa TaxID=3103831 RepID=A0AAP0C993_9ASTR